MTAKRYQAVLTPLTLMTLGADSPVHNGGFNVWQRGTSFVSPTIGTYTADRWAYYAFCAAAHTALQSTDVPTAAALVPQTNYSIHLDVTTADNSISAIDFCLLGQRIEGYAWVPFAQKQFTIGFWVKDTITGAHAVALVNSGGDRSCVMEYTVSVADTWEYKTLTFPASPSAGTWDYTTGIGASLYFTLAAGSTYQTTAGAWQTGEFYGTSSTVNSVSSTSNNFKLWGVTMGLGTTVAPFWPRQYGQELALCQRYFERMGGTVQFQAFAVGLAGTTTVGYFTLPYQFKRGLPAITFSAGNTFALQYHNTTATCSAIAAADIGVDSARIDGTLGSALLTVGESVRLIDGGLLTGFISISADL